MWWGRKKSFYSHQPSRKSYWKIRSGTKACSLWTYRQDAGLDELVIEGISGHSMRVGVAQDLLNSGASMPIIMQRGRWSKTDTVMRYVEQSNCAG